MKAYELVKRLQQIGVAADMDAATAEELSEMKAGSAACYAWMLGRVSGMIAGLVECIETYGVESDA